jgi:hypothetical protein
VLELNSKQCKKFPKFREYSAVFMLKTRRNAKYFKDGFALKVDRAFKRDHSTGAGWTELRLTHQGAQPAWP